MAARGARVPPELSAAGLAAVVGFLATITCPTLARRVVALAPLLARPTEREVRDLTGMPPSTASDLARRPGACDGPEGVAALPGAKWAGGRRNPPDGEAGDRLVEEMGRQNFFTLAQIRAWPSEGLGAGVGARAISRFLRDNGFRKPECGSLPARAKEALQAEFWHGTTGPLPGEAEEGRRTVLFCDASHFVAGCDFLGSVWCLGRRYVRTLPGRQRHDVLGAYDWVTHKVTAVTNCDCVNASTVVGLFAKLRESYGKGRKVTPVLDNARYQKCKYVSGQARKLNVELVYIPPYSPNPDLIERLWRLARTDPRRRHWDSFEDFRDRIGELVEPTTGENEERVVSLMGEGAQLLDSYEEIFGGTYETPPRAREGDREIEAEEAQRAS